MKAELAELATRAQEGDADALEELVRALEQPIYRLAVRFLGHRDEARDATQEILIVIVTKLSTFRGESAIETWAYRVASRHLLRMRSARGRYSFEQLVENDLAQPANEIAPSALEAAEARLLEEEVFLGCTQAMLLALDRSQRIAFVLGAICELSSEDAAYALNLSEAAFRKRLSRARATLDAFMLSNCGVANPDNPCRCKHQVNHNVALGRLNPRCLQMAVETPHTPQTSLDALRALGEIKRMRRSVELYQAQPVPSSPENFAARLRSLVDGEGGFRIFDA